MHFARFFVTVLGREFEVDGGVDDVVVCEDFLHLVLNLGVILFYHHVQSGEMVKAINTADVEMMHVNNTGDLRNFAFQFAD